MYSRLDINPGRPRGDRSLPPGALVTEGACERPGVARSGRRVGPGQGGSVDRRRRAGRAKASATDPLHVVPVGESHPIGATLVLADDDTPPAAVPLGHGLPEPEEPRAG